MSTDRFCLNLRKGIRTRFPWKITYEICSHHFSCGVRAGDRWHAPSHLAIQAECVAGARPHGNVSCDKLFGTECAACHGLDGHTPTDAGRWMYPRAADLTSHDAQLYSDRELFWIVKNGIRLSGMPAFGKVETDEHIWNLAQFVRTLRDSTNPH